MLSKYDAIVFDFDGVLVESVDVKTKAFADLYSEYGDGIVRQVVDYHILNGGLSRFTKFKHYHENLLGKSLSKEEEISLGERFSKYVEDAVIAAEYVAGAYDFLEEYYQRIPLFVASATPDEELNRIVSRREMMHYFVSIHGSPSKKADIIGNVLTKYGFDHDRVLMVGDAIADYEGAIAADVKFIGRVTRYPSTNPFPIGTLVLPDLVDLAKI